MKTTALLTGRGNNTLKDKNVLDILGKPVLYYPAHAGAKSRYIQDKYCSSDDEKILRAASDEGYESIVRPKELSLPTSQHVDCILSLIHISSYEYDVLAARRDIFYKKLSDLGEK